MLMHCNKCGAECERRGNRQKYCPACSPVAVRREGRTINYEGWTMKRFAPLALALLVLPAGPLAASANDERLVAPALPGFAVGHSQAGANGMIREETPKGETVQNWKRMVTTQRFT